MTSLLLYIANRIHDVMSLLLYLVYIPLLGDSSAIVVWSCSHSDMVCGLITDMGLDVSGMASSNDNSFVIVKLKQKKKNQ